MHRNLMQCLIPFLGLRVGVFFLMVVLLGACENRESQELASATGASQTALGLTTALAQDDDGNCFAVVSQYVGTCASDIDRETANLRAVGWLKLGETFPNTVAYVWQYKPGKLTFDLLGAGNPALRSPGTTRALVEQVPALLWVDATSELPDGTRPHMQLATGFSSPRAGNEIRSTATKSVAKQLCKGLYKEVDVTQLFEEEKAIFNNLAELASAHGRNFRTKLDKLCPADEFVVSGGGGC